MNLNSIVFRIIGLGALQAHDSWTIFMSHYKIYKSVIVEDLHIFSWMQDDCLNLMSWCSSLIYNQGFHSNNQREQGVREVWKVGMTLWELGQGLNIRSCPLHYKHMSPRQSTYIIGNLSCETRKLENLLAQWYICIVLSLTWDDCARHVC